MSNLPSGYHRDIQLTKEILFPAIEELKACLGLAFLMLSQIIVKDNILDDKKYAHLFTVEKVNDLVNNGIPFRDAYRQVGNEVHNGDFSYTSKLNHTHKGSIGNLCNPEIEMMMKDLMKKFS